MSSKDNNALEVGPFNPKEKRTDGRRKPEEKGKMKRGVWTHGRELALLVAYRSHRPYGVGYEERTEKWNLLCTDVNKKDAEQTPSGKQATIGKLLSLIEQYKPTFTELESFKASGSNRFFTDMEQEVYHT